MVNLFGKGFIGTHYSNMFPCIVNDRNDLTVKTNEILYMISTTDNYNVQTNPYLDIDTNLTTLIRVLENCRGKDIVFNFISSWFVYGQTTTPYNEETHCNPKGFYSITKRTAEQLLISYCETFNLKYRILRLANVIGLGDNRVSAKKNALTFLINEIKKNNEIKLYDNGIFYRDYIHVKDACVAINLILKKGNLNEIYNVGNGQSTQFRDAIDYVINKTNSKSKIINIPQSDFHKKVQVKSMQLNTDKLKKLGYRPSFTLNDILDELIK